MGSLVGSGGILFQRVGDECEHLLILIQQQHRPKVSQPLVCESWRGEEFEAFYLAEVRSLAEGEEVEELGDVVSPVIA